MAQRPLPEADEVNTSPFWSGLREGYLMLQRCATCDALRYPAAPLCPECLAAGFSWTEVPAGGSLWSFVTYHRDLSGGAADILPYTIGVVQIDGGIGVTARVDEPAATLSVGDQMCARYEEVSPAVTLLRWIKASEGTSVA